MSNVGRIEYGLPPKRIGPGLHDVEVGRSEHDPAKADLPRHLLSYEHAPMVRKEQQ
jgi:hypothetical protein